MRNRQYIRMRLRTCIKYNVYHCKYKIDLKSIFNFDFIHFILFFFIRRYNYLIYIYTNINIQIIKLHILLINFIYYIMYYMIYSIIKKSNSCIKFLILYFNKINFINIKIIICRIIYCYRVKTTR